jgi:hypothetical protein
MSVVAGPVTSMRTRAIRVGSPVETFNVTVIGVAWRSMSISVVAEKNPSTAAAPRTSSIASLARRSRRSFVISSYFCQRTSPTSRSSVSLSGDGASMMTR